MQNVILKLNQRSRKVGVSFGLNRESPSDNSIPIKQSLAFVIKDRSTKHCASQSSVLGVFPC